MEVLKAEFKYLENCKPLELIRLNLREHTEWALVGRKGNGLFPVLILTGKNAPRCINAAADAGGNLKFHYVRAPALSYGHAYALRPDLTGPCDVYEGPIFSAQGALIITGALSGGGAQPIVSKNNYLRATFSEGRPFVLFHLNNGTLGGTPEANENRAAFGNWELSLINPERESEKISGTPSICVTKFSAQIAPEAAQSFRE